MKYLVKLFYILLLLVCTISSCKDSSGNKLAKNEKNVESQKEVLSRDINQEEVLDSSIVDILLEYVSKNQIKTDIDTNEFVEESYFVAFYSASKDTLLAIGKHPFVFEIAPYFLPESYSNKSLLKQVGFTNNDSIPIVIYSTEKQLSKGFYNNNLLDSIPPKYYLDSKEYNYYVSPVWIYKIIGNKISKERYKIFDSVVLK